MRFLSIIVGALLFAANPSEAGIFTMPHFVEPTKYSLGLEPELTLNDGAGIGINAKYFHGISELANAMGVVGFGSGPRNFRIGGAMVFDFFPDVEGQPGIGLGVQGIYYRRRDFGRLELTAIPYVHKGFQSGGTVVEPFLGIPFGFGFRSQNYDGLFSVVVGSIFSNSESVSYVVELGVNVEHSDTYIAGGVSFSH